MIKTFLRKVIPLTVREKIHYLKTFRQVKQQLADLKTELLYYKVLYYYQANPSAEYSAEIDYLKETGKLTPFPYKQVKQSPEVDGALDVEKKMPYVMHAGKRLYFPVGWSVNAAKQMYLNYITTENILGGGYTEKSPHQYLANDFQLSNDTLLVDIGAAEGLFLLDMIDVIDQAILFEPSQGWLVPLKATFAAYTNKVTIIEKFATDRDSETEARIDSVIKPGTKSVFIKMDVEGYEQSVLRGAEKLFTESMNIKVACCTYHRNDDAEKLQEYFERRGFATAFSDGYMLFPYDDAIAAPYFRKGVIRATKNA
jgi:hypothetical protein